MAMAAGRAEVRRDDALSALPSSPAPGSPFSPHDLHALQQLQLRGSLSPHQASFPLSHDQHQLHYHQPAIRIHPSVPVPVTSQPEAFSQQPIASDEAFAHWQQQQPPQPHIQHGQAHQYAQQQPYWPQAIASNAALNASDSWDHANLWELSNEANFGLSPAQIPAHHLAHQQSQQHQQQQRASSTSSYASFGPHTPPPSSHHLAPSVEDFESEGLPYQFNDSFPRGLTQEVLRDFDKFCSAHQDLDITVQSAQQQQQLQQVQALQPQQNHAHQQLPHALAPTHSQTYRFSRDAQSIFQSQRRLAQQRIMSQDSNGIMGPPHLPRTESTDTDGGFKSSGEPAVPKLDRTMSDVYADTLFHSNTNEGLSPTSRAKQSLSQEHSQPSGIIQERLQEAYVDQMKRSQSPSSSVSRQRSPFKPNAPESPNRDHFPSRPDGHPRSAAQMREWAKAQRDQAAAAQHAGQMAGELDEPAKTVSPKEVALDFKEDDDDMSGAALFADGPPHKRQKKDGSTLPRIQPAVSRENTRMSDASDFSQPSYNSMATSRRESSQSTNGGTGKMQYAFFNKARRQHSQTSVTGSDSQSQTPVDSMTPSLPMGESSRGGEYERKRSHASSAASPSTPRPRALSKHESFEEDTDYTYTCTYHGCTKRFESQSALQKHKREIHHSTAHHSRNSVSNTSANSPDAQSPTSAHRKSASVDDSDSSTPPGSASAANANSQAGPHICTRINPTTGKPCNSQFSRPYDLTRHEDTIHNAKKEKVKCALCKDEKTFSRSDALTRHMRVVHGQKDGPASRGRPR